MSLLILEETQRVKHILSARALVLLCLSLIAWFQIFVIYFSYYVAFVGNYSQQRRTLFIIGNGSTTRDSSGTIFTNPPPEAGVDYYVFIRLYSDIDVSQSVIIYIISPEYISIYFLAVIRYTMYAWGNLWYNYKKIQGHGGAHLIYPTKFNTVKWHFYAHG